MSKRCKSCLKIKSLNEFYKNPNMKDGRTGVCKACKLSFDRNKRLETADISRLFLTWGKV